MGLTPKISVLMPVYNGEAYIAEAIESVLNSTFTDFELMVLNDGSTDCTVDIVNSFDDDRIVLFDHEDIGQAENLNDGLRKAIGDYVCEVDADDTIAPSHLDRLYAAAVFNNADVVKCNYNEMTDEEGFRFYQAQQVAPSPEFRNRPLNIRDLPPTQKSALVCRTPCVFAGLYSREFLIRNGLFWRSGKAYEDTSISFKIAAAAERFVWLNFVTYNHRNDNPNSGTATIFNTEGLIEQMAECRRFSAARNLDLDDWISTWSFYTYLWMLGRIKTPIEQARFLLQMRADFQKHPAPEPYFNSLEDYLFYEAVRKGDYT